MNNCDADHAPVIPGSRSCAVMGEPIGPQVDGRGRVSGTGAQSNVVKPNARPIEVLTVGSRVFYPSHGVACVSGQEEREFSGHKQLFYVLTLDRGITVLLPLQKVAQAGLRELVSPDKARELMKKVKTEPDAEPEGKIDRASRKKRDAVYAEALRSGSADEYTEILRQLLFRSRSEKLSSSEQHVLDLARSCFVGEIGAALDRPAEEIEEDLRSVVESS